MSIPTFKPSIHRKELDSVLSTMVEDQIGSGPVTQKLIDDVGNYLGLNNGVAFREYGRGIRTALESLGVEKGASVIISPLAPSTYMEVFLEKGIEPLLADVDPDSGCIMVEHVEKLKEKNPSALILHYTLGYIPEVEQIKEMGIPIIEDISQGFGGHTGGQKCGTFGNYVLLALEPENIITAGGGTVIFAGGKKEGTALRRTAGLFPKEVFLQDMNSAMGISQIKNIDTFLEKRKEIAQIFSRALMQSKHKTLIQKGDAEKENTCYSFPVLLNSGLKEVRQYARKKNVETSLAFEDSIIGKFEITDQDISQAQSMLLRCLLFPLYPNLGKSNLTQIQKVLSTLP